MALPASDSRLLHAFGFGVESRKAPRADWDPSSSAEQAIEVAALLDTLGFSDPDVIVAAVVRARVADVSSASAEIARRFGSEVWALVEELAAPNRLDPHARLEWLLKRMPSASPCARTMLLASVVVSLRHLPPAWNEARRTHYVHWVQHLRALAPDDTRFDAHFREALLIARSARPAPPSNGGASRPPAWLLHELNRARAQIAAIEERLSDLIAGVPSGVSTGPVAVPVLVGDKPGSARKHVTRAASLQAMHGVGKVDFRSPDARTVLVSFDRGREFALPPMLADLLKVISSASGAASDGFVEFQPIATVVSELVRRGHRSSHRAVTVAINRLRDRLAELHHPPLWVDTSDHGVRLRLRVPE
jgi:hypothetical protein